MGKISARAPQNGTFRCREGWHRGRGVRMAAVAVPTFGGAGWAPCRVGDIPRGTPCPRGSVWSQGMGTGPQGSHVWALGAQQGVHMAGVGGRPGLLAYNYCPKRPRVSCPFFVPNSQGLQIS